MPRPRTVSLATNALAFVAVTGLMVLGSAQPAAAQQPAPVQVQLQPLPPLQPQPGPTVIIQEAQPQIYQAPVYQQSAPLVLSPSVLKRWDESQPIPPGYHVEEHIRRGLVIGGACLFGSTYLLSALVAAADADANSGQSNPAAALWVPGVGPFIEMTQTSSAVADLFLVIDGLAQMGGLAMFTVGLVAPKAELVHNDFGSMKLHFTPVVARDHSGMALGGVF